MKKFVVLYSNLVLSLGIWAQQNQLLKIDPQLAHQSMMTHAIAQGAETSFAQSVAITKANSFAPLAKITAMNEKVVGTTYYDLQTNGCIADRIFVNPNGTIGLTWIMETTPSAGAPNRGTGYNYFNGTTWQTLPSTRLEANRSGWPCIAYTRSGRELVVCHNSVVKNLQLTSRATPGAGAWTESTSFVTSPTPGGNWWPRMVTKGDTVYLLSVTFPVSGGGTAYQGLDGAITFCRSRDGGLSWDIQHQIPTGLDASKFIGFDGDSYAIAARDSVVAIVAGNSTTDLVLIKSTNAGQTWTSTRILKFPIPRWDYTTQNSDADHDGIADTLKTNDGNFCVALDNKNNAYVFYGRMLVKQSVPKDGYSYFPYTDGLMMWKEGPGFGVDTGGVLVAGVEDWNNDGKINLPKNAGNLPFGQYLCALTSHPSAAFDADGKLYLTFSSLKETSVYSESKVMRHTFIVSSADGGLTWTNTNKNSCDLVMDEPGAALEGVFGSIAKRVDGNVHVAYQRDFNPGLSGTTDTENNGQTNEIVYVRIPVSDIGTCALLPNTIHEQTGIIQSVSVFPNPAKDKVSVTIAVKAEGKGTLHVNNLLGQHLASYPMNASVDQNNRIDLDLTTFEKGVYILQCEIHGATSYNKLIVE